MKEMEEGSKKQTRKRRVRGGGGSSCHKQKSGHGILLSHPSPPKK